MMILGNSISLAPHLDSVSKFEMRMILYQKSNSPFFRCRKGLVFPVLLAATITLASGGNIQGVPSPFPWLKVDKWAHFFVFGLLAIALLRTNINFEKIFSIRWGLFCWISVSLFGLSDELHQYTTPERYFEWADLLADSVGAAVAVLAYQRWPFFRYILELPLKTPRENTLPTDKAQNNSSSQ